MYKVSNSLAGKSICLPSQQGFNSHSDKICGDWFLTIQHWTFGDSVYLSWLAWPHKWQSHLTDLEWDIKEPLRMTSSLAVTTLSVPIGLPQGLQWKEVLLYAFLCYLWSNYQNKQANKLELHENWLSVPPGCWLPTACVLLAALCPCVLHIMQLVHVCTSV